MTVRFYTSCAGIAGDPHKLLVAEIPNEGIRETELYSTWALFNWDFWYARWKLLRRIKSKIVTL